MHHTLSYLIPGDMALNWFLDFALVFFSSVVEGLLGPRPLAPGLVYQVILGGISALCCLADDGADPAADRATWAGICGSYG